MNHEEARAVLRSHLERYRRLSHGELAKMIGNQGCDEVAGASGVSYQIEVDVLWDRDRGGDLRVIGSIDDGGWRAFAPLSDGFLLAPDGTLR